MVTGLPPGADVRGARAHGACGADPLASGGHYQHSSDATVPLVEREVWLDVTSDERGRASPDHACRGRSARHCGVGGDPRRCHEPDHRCCRRPAGVHGASRSAADRSAGGRLAGCMGPWAPPPSMARVPIEPDTKDWTWVLRASRAPSAASTPPTSSAPTCPRLIRDNARGWSRVLAGPDAPGRPRRDVWSPLEYACHVRDVHRLFDERLRADARPRTTRGSPTGTRTRPRSRSDYAEQDPAVVGAELVDGGRRRGGDVYAAVHRRPVAAAGLRAATAVEFTVETLGRYHLHDVVHHLHDVGDDRRASDGRRRTTATPRRTPPAPAPMPDAVRARARPLRRAARRRARGCWRSAAGGGRDALRAGGSRARASGAPTSRPRFVELLRAQGYDADLLDPLTDDLSPPDGRRTTACGPTPACCTSRATDLPTVLSRLAAATRPGGLLRHVAQGGRRRAAGRRTATSAARGTSPTGARSRCAPSLDGGRLGRRASPLEHGDGSAASRGSRSSRRDAAMRHTEFWARLDAALGPAYSRAWAEHVRDRRARRPHRRRGARRRRTPQAGLGRRLACPRAPPTDRSPHRHPAEVRVLACRSA